MVSTAVEPTVVVDRYLSDLSESIAAVDRAALGRAVCAVARCLTQGQQVFVAGNGGSAAAASHLACDWNAATAGYATRPRTTSLSADPVGLTATANDHGFREVFARQIDAWGRSGDAAVFLSVSGSSPDIELAARAARARRMRTVAVFGSAGSAAALVDDLVLVGAGDYGLAEDLQISFGHIVVRALRDGAPHQLRSALQP